MNKYYCTEQMKHNLLIKEKLTFTDLNESPSKNHE